MGLKRKRLSSGLVGHWLTDDSDPATAPDHSGNLNHGTITGATWAVGVVGRALSFNGSSDNVDVGAGATLDRTDAITISVWVNRSGAGTGNYPAIVGKNIVDDKYPYALRADTVANKFTFASFDVAPLFTIASNDVITNDVWYNVVGVFDESLASANAKMYVNGAIQTATANYTSPLPTNTATVKIGQYATSYFEGLIDDVRIWNRALSAHEILDLHTKGRQRHGI